MITHVAIRFDGKVWSLPKPNRHHHIIRLIVEQTNVSCVDGEERDQGFLNHEGLYLDRFQALEEALRCGQVKAPDQIRAGRLFSEDLW